MFRSPPRHARPSLVRWRAALVALTLAAGLALTGLASAAISDGPGNGNPAVNNSGKCPPGQNPQTSPGGLKKCPE